MSRFEGQSIDKPANIKYIAKKYIKVILRNTLILTSGMLLTSSEFGEERTAFRGFQSSIVPKAVPTRSCSLKPFQRGFYCPKVAYQLLRHHLYQTYQY